MTPRTSDPMTSWQPIATCPVNAAVLIYVPNGEHYGHGVYRAILCDFGSGRRWHTTGRHVGRDLIDEADAPTHWMPLPEPPQ